MKHRATILAPWLAATAVLLSGCALASPPDGALPAVASQPPSSSAASVSSAPAASSAAASRSPSGVKIYDIDGPWMPTRDVGDAGKLLGRCVIIDVYLSDSGSSFTAGQKKAEESEESEALSFLAGKKAAVNSAPLTFIDEKPDLTFDYTVDSGIPTDLTDCSWSYDVLDAVWQQDHFDQIGAAYDADSVAVYLHVNKTGTSYTLQCDGSTSPHEGSVMYAGIPDDAGGAVESGPFTYAHELMHQFGAIDLYYPFLTDDPRIAMAAAEFPDDLMRVYTYHLSTATLSDVDLYAVGWSDTLPAKDAVYVEAPYD